MEGTSYQASAMIFKKKGQTKKDEIIEGCLGLSGETGEVVDMIKKYMYQGHELDYDKLSEELGDVLWYLAFLSDSCGLDLDHIMEKNIYKLNLRYPYGFDPTRSVKREKE